MITEDVNKDENVDDTYNNIKQLFHYTWLNSYIDSFSIKINIKSEYTSMNVVYMATLDMISLKRIYQTVRV